MPDLKKKLKNGAIAIGTWVTINHPDVVDILSELPFDWLVFDMEHAPLEVSDVEILMMPLRNTKTAPIVRVPWNDMVIIKRVLDIGAEGILVPWVNTKEEAEAAIRYTSYPPKGVRGVGPRKAVRYGFRPFLDYYNKFERDERVIIVQVETSKALENLEDILSVSGIDVAYIGPMDLSVNLGIPLQYDNPVFVEAVNKVLKICMKYDVVPGIHTFTIEQLKKYSEMGFRFMAIGSDTSLLIRSAREILENIGKM
jgi:2-keto-3-deoxy-L-rhamnonate aldolase RhmA